MFKFFALCLMAVVALTAAKPGIVAPLAYTTPVVTADPYTAAYTAAYAAPYTTAYTAPYYSTAYTAPYVAAPYASAYTYPYAASYLLRK
ncbi:uncharacterized protein [Musca autumnalis]|uniref:uncharacterized protein n=1 Tax=Musca autumnalis TaxID=221902 RepID=UPI003CF0FBC8